MDLAALEPWWIEAAFSSAFWLTETASAGSTVFGWDAERGSSQKLLGAGKKLEGNRGNERVRRGKKLEKEGGQYGNTHGGTAPPIF